MSLQQQDHEVMEFRVASLEQRLLGCEGATADKRKLIDELVSINNKLQETLANRDKLKKTLNELPSFSDYLDPSYSDTLCLPADAKLRVIESCASTLEKRVHQLELLNEARPILDSEHIQKVPALNQRLSQLASVQFEQIQQASRRNNEVSNLLRSYNEVILNLNKQFAYWDDVLTKLEEKKFSTARTSS